MKMCTLTTFVAILAALFTPSQIGQAYAQQTEMELVYEEPEEKMPWQLVVHGEIGDEFKTFYPNKIQMAQIGSSWNPHLEYYQEWQDVEEAAINNIYDGVQHGMEKLVVRSEWFQRASSWIEHRIGLIISSEYRREHGEYGEKDFSIDASFSLLKGSHEDRHLWLDPGISFEHLRDPAFFVKSTTWKNGKGDRVIFKARFEPLDEKFELSTDGLPLNLDWRVWYDRDDDIAGIDLVEIPCTTNRPSDIYTYMGVEHDFHKDETWFTWRISGNFKSLTDWWHN